MAFYHCSVKAVQRSKGQTATRSASYRAGEKIQCERTGLIHDYRRKTGVMHKEIITPNGINAPSREQLWNMAEKSEKRKDSCVAREYEVALPHELNEQQRTALAQDFCKHLAKNYGVAVDLCIHRPTDKEVKKGADPRNHHAHILTTTRIITNDGLGAKADIEKAGRNRKDDLQNVRKAWADYANEHLKKAGLNIEIDHRSHMERGLEIAPTIKMGVSATAMERKGIRTEKGDINRMIQQSNLEIQELHTELPAKTVKLPVTAAIKDDTMQAVIGGYRNTEHFALDASLRAGFIEINLNTMQLVKETITKDYLVTKSKRREFIQNLQDHATAFLNINDEYIQAMQSVFGDYKLPAEFRDEIDNAFEYINKSKHIDLDAYYTVNEISDDVSISKEQKIQIQSTNNYEYQP